MIVRVLGDGQFELADAHTDELNAYDAALAAALDADDDEAFRTALHAMVATVLEHGGRVPDEVLVPSDVVLPQVDATLDEVRAMLGTDGLVPG